MTVDARPSMAKKKLTWFQPREPPNFVSTPFGAPEMNGDDMGKQLIVADVPSSEMIGDRTLKPFGGNKIKTPDARAATRRTIRGSIECDFVVMFGEIQE
jgi:hypothetical protein